MSESMLEKLFQSAANHGADSGEPDHTVGDLQELLRAAWNIMSVSQKLQWLRQPQCEAVIEDGARDAFCAEDLLREMSDIDVIQKALRHVNEHHPIVTQVFYGGDGRWLYCGEEFEAPVFGPEIDVSLLEDAADATSWPAAYALERQA